ncbi:hypothetical protein X768_16730 [Mesorhizobium sp. LSJC265A00]|nr:hypothetical protein X768_16730 [Mesorhizobium sp. LSJC265A00]
MRVKLSGNVGWKGGYEPVGRYEKNWAKAQGSTIRPDSMLICMGLKTPCILAILSPRDFKLYELSQWAAG